jgi:hypothetical protein
MTKKNLNKPDKTDDSTKDLHPKGDPDTTNDVSQDLTTALDTPNPSPIVILTEQDKKLLYNFATQKIDTLTSQFQQFKKQHSDSIPQWVNSIVELYIHLVTKEDTTGKGTLYRRATEPLLISLDESDRLIQWVDTTNMSDLIWYIKSEWRENSNYISFFIKWRTLKNPSITPAEIMSKCVQLFHQKFMKILQIIDSDRWDTWSIRDGRRCTIDAEVWTYYMPVGAWHNKNKTNDLIKKFDATHWSSDDITQPKLHQWNDSSPRIVSLDDGTEIVIKEYHKLSLQEVLDYYLIQKHFGYWYVDHKTKIPKNQKIQKWYLYTVKVVMPLFVRQKWDVIQVWLPNISWLILSQSNRFSKIDPSLPRTLGLVLTSQLKEYLGQPDAKIVINPMNIKPQEDGEVVITDCADDIPTVLSIANDTWLLPKLKDIDNYDMIDGLQHLQDKYQHLQDQNLVLQSETQKLNERLKQLGESQIWEQYYVLQSKIIAMFDEIVKRKHPDPNISYTNLVAKWIDSIVFEWSDGLIYKYITNPDISQTDLEIYYTMLSDFDTYATKSQVSWLRAYHGRHDIVCTTDGRLFVTLDRIVWSPWVKNNTYGIGFKTIYQNITAVYREFLWQWMEHDEIWPYNILKIDDDIIISDVTSIKDAVAKYIISLSKKTESNWWSPKDQITNSLLPSKQKAQAFLDHFQDTQYQKNELAQRIDEAHKIWWPYTDFKQAQKYWFTWKESDLIQNTDGTLSEWWEDKKQVAWLYNYTIHQLWRKLIKLASYALTLEQRKRLLQWWYCGDINTAYSYITEQALRESSPHIKSPREVEISWQLGDGAGIDGVYTDSDEYWISCIQHKCFLMTNPKKDHTASVIKDLLAKKKISFATIKNLKKVENKIIITYQGKNLKEKTLTILTMPPTMSPEAQTKLFVHLKKLQADQKFNPNAIKTLLFENKQWANGYRFANISTHMIWHKHQHKSSFLINAVICTKKPTDTDRVMTPDSNQPLQQAEIEAVALPATIAWVIYSSIVKEYITKSGSSTWPDIADIQEHTEGILDFLKQDINQKASSQTNWAENAIDYHSLIAHLDSATQLAISQKLISKVTVTTSEAPDQKKMMVTIMLWNEILCQIALYKAPIIP